MEAQAPMGLTFLLLAGCAGGATLPAAAGLAYGEPDPNPVRYSVSDTATFEIQAPGYGVMEVETAHSGTAELYFHERPRGYRVDVLFPELDGSFRTAGQGVERVTAADVGGAVGVQLSPTGAVVVVDSPRVTAAFEDVTGLESLVRPLFVPLPGGAASPGARWVDTVETREESVGTVSRGRRITVSTLVGDTSVAGRRLLRIATATETEIEVTGVSGGVEIEQRMSGVLAGTVLWDPESHLLVDRTEAGSLSGSLTMGSADVAEMPVTARVRRRVRLHR